MDCPICMEIIVTSTNCVTTECGHIFHSSCLMKNTSINGYGCPCCRTQMAEEPDESINSDDDEYDSDDEFEFDTAEEENYTLMGFRWFFQRVYGEDPEGDAEEYEEFQKEEREWDQESKKSSKEVKAKIDNILIGLKRINTISYEELLQAFIHKSVDTLLLNTEAEIAFQKVHSTIQSISEKNWA